MWPSVKNWSRLSFACVTAAYLLWCASKPEYRFTHNVHLLMHEPGHLLLLPFGQFVSVAGGTLFQLIIPVAFVVYFYRRGDLYAAFIVLFWLGDSLLDVSVYAADAIAMDIPPAFGDEDIMIHDWNYMLTRLGMLNAAPQIAMAIRILGVLIIVGAACGAVKHSFTGHADETSPNHARRL